MQASQKKKYIAYYRVSTDKQGRSGLGLEAQKNSVKTYVARDGGVITDSYTEVSSGRDNNREELQRALKAAMLKKCIIVIAKLDRLSRNRRFLMELSESSAKFVCCDMPEANSLTIGMMAVMADYETQVISERTKAALQAAKARGVKLGNPRLDECRNTDTTAANTVRIAQAAVRNTSLLEIIKEIEYEHGKMSLRAIAKQLNDAGYTAPRGGKFSAAQVSKVIKSGNKK